MPGLTFADDLQADGKENRVPSNGSSEWEKIKRKNASGKQRNNIIMSKSKYARVFNGFRVYNAWYDDVILLLAFKRTNVLGRMLWVMFASF